LRGLRAEDGTIHRHRHGVDYGSSHTTPDQDVCARRYSVEGCRLGSAPG